jgi:serine phosphatase RsbU (regulator of sigma subunit)
MPGSPSHPRGSAATNSAVVRILCAKLGPAPYVPGQIGIQPGDVLMLNSEGLVEATNVAGEEFGESCLEALLSESLRDSPETIRDSNLAGVRAFSEG